MDPMQYRKLGRSDLDVSVVGYGGWGIADAENWGPQDPDAAFRAICAAQESGITFFDTADSYGDGQSERMIGEALRGVRDRVILSTKLGRQHTTATQVARACERSLANLGTDRIDLYQVHWPVPTSQSADIFGALEELRKQGKIRHIGLSNHGLRDLATVQAKLPNVVSNQMAYSLLFRAIEFDILPRCRKEQIPILCYSPLIQGLLSGRYATADSFPAARARSRLFSSSRPLARHGEPGCEEEVFRALPLLQNVAREIGESLSAVSIAWLLAQSGVACVIAGARSAFSAKQNARAGNLILSESVLSRLTQVTEEVKARLGPNPDLWQTPSRIN
jgi:aryl-alcohol dehydrogenase-like predicted oxidoreductase